MDTHTEEILMLNLQPTAIPFYNNLAVEQIALTTVCLEQSRYELRGSCASLTLVREYDSSPLSFIG